MPYRSPPARGACSAPPRSVWRFLVDVPWGHVVFFGAMWSISIHGSVSGGRFWGLVALGVGQVSVIACWATWRWRLSRPAWTPAEVSESLRGGAVGSSGAAKKVLR